MNPPIVPHCVPVICSKFRILSDLFVLEILGCGKWINSKLCFFYKFKRHMADRAKKENCSSIRFLCTCWDLEFFWPTAKPFRTQWVRGSLKLALLVVGQYRVAVSSASLYQGFPSKRGYSTVMEFHIEADDTQLITESLHINFNQLIWVILMYVTSNCCSCHFDLIKVRFETSFWP